MPLAVSSFKFHWHLLPGPVARVSFAPSPGVQNGQRSCVRHPQLGRNSGRWLHCQCLSERALQRKEARQRHYPVIVVRDRTRPNLTPTG